ncbi:hypothetical protein OH77DRAFT_1498333 [Trametes cingulata]|nr:hypothetical protein OH77DRAFT_1498333 [Trametes cingulata]
MLSKIVNALTAMREIGGPAACSYLLGIPDHYTNHTFKVFYWYAYVAHASTTLPQQGDHDGATEADERVVVGLQGDKVVPLSKVNDYIFRPAFFENWSLYDYLRSTDIRKLRKKADNPELPKATYRLHASHPLYATHVVHRRAEETEYVLNFVGGTLPRPDRGDLAVYQKTMLVLFRPWRNGRDLLGCSQSLPEAFASYTFSEQAMTIMKNMNVLYECYDARDDYSASRRAQDEVPSEFGRMAQYGTSSDELIHETETLAFVDTERDLLALLDDPSCRMNKRGIKKAKEMQTMRELLSRAAYETVNRSTESQGFPVWEAARRPTSYWKDVVAKAKEAVLDSRKAPKADNNVSSPIVPVIFRNSDTVSVVTMETLQRQYPGFVDAPIQDSAIRVLATTLEHFTLNAEQRLAFTIVAYAVQHHSHEPLHMILAGMAGTGKSEVLKALISFMEARNERGRLLVLAPTGSSACNVNGYTYHSALKPGGYGRQEARQTAW